MKKYRHWQITLEVAGDGHEPESLTEIVEAPDQASALDAFAKLGLGEPNFRAVERAIKEGGGELRIEVKRR